MEKANHVAAQRWWRTLADDVTAEQAQASLDRWCALRGDTRLRPTSDGRATVLTLAALTLAATEPLASLPAPFPAVLAVARVASAQALVSFRGNHYSVPAELARAQVTVSHRLGASTVDIATSSGILMARHRLASPGAGATLRDTEHVAALERAAMAAFTDAPPHRRKQRIPPGPAARAAAAALRSDPTTQPTATSTATSTAASTTDAPAAIATSEVVVDLARYTAAAQGRNTLR